MSAGFIGTIGSIAAGPLQQARAADADRTTQEVASQSRHKESNRLAENASGIGQTEKEGEASERDADGRRLWEQGQERSTQQAAAVDEATQPEARGSKDPSHMTGNQLDLSG